MEVKMNKEIREYNESMFFGLNFRQCFFSLLAILTAVGIYFAGKDALGDELTGWLCVLGAAPFAACGFFKYHGMTAEQFLWAFIKSELLYPKRLVFQSENLYHVCMEEVIAAGEKGCRDGTVLLDKQRQKGKGRQKQSRSERKKQRQLEKKQRKDQKKRKKQEKSLNRERRDAID